MIEVTADVPTFDLTDPSQRSALRRLAPRLDLDCSKPCRGKAFVGAFSREAADAANQHGSVRSDSDTPVEVAIVRGDSISVYRNGRLLDQTTIGDGVSTVPKQWRRLQVVRLIDDGTLQILCHWESTTTVDTADNSKPASTERQAGQQGGKGAEDEQSNGQQKPHNQTRISRLHVGLYKVVGEYIGQPFERVIAKRRPGEDSLERLGRYEFISRNDRPAIRWSTTPAAQSGETTPTSSPGEAVLIWNSWEGVFRPPSPPPTAPDQTS